MSLLKSSFLSLFSILFLFNTSVQAGDSKSALMNAAIIGGIGSLAFACYEGKDPCTLAPNINWNQKTLSTDIGSDNTMQNARFALGVNWQDPIYESGRFSINGRWEVSGDLWYSSDLTTQNTTGWMIGLSPIFNYNWKMTSKLTPYIETGSGIQYLSDSTIENKFKSTQFQFSDILGFGIKIDRQLEMGYRYLHISNANISLPNPGTDIHNFHIAYKF